MICSLAEGMQQPAFERLVNNFNSQMKQAGGRVDNWSGKKARGMLLFHPNPIHPPPSYLSSRLEAGCHSRPSNTANSEGIRCCCTIGFISNSALHSLLSNKAQVHCSSDSFTSGLHMLLLLIVSVKRLTIC